jgi:predicted membrane metal-binding protein
MAGIAHIHPYLSRFWPQDGRNIFRRIWESASLSISCQITTGPLAWLYFRSFPRHFLLANLIAAPLTGVIITSALALLAADAMGFCPQILVKLTELSVSLMTGALKTIASM